MPPPSIVATFKQLRPHPVLGAGACSRDNALLQFIGTAAGPVLLTKLCDRRSPLARAFRKPGTLGTGVVRLTPRRHAYATSYEPRVSGNGHTAAGVSPLQQHAAQPAAAPHVGSQPAVPLTVQSPPTSGDIILHNAPPEQRKVCASGVLLAVLTSLPRIRVSAIALPCKASAA